MTLKPKRLAAYRDEAALAKGALAKGDLDEAFRRLERAHILGQPSAGAHSWAHWTMLKVGLRRRDWREVRGQVIRLAAGGLLSWMGRLPVGNTGGADVPAEAPMPVPSDLVELCQ